MIIGIEGLSLLYHRTGTSTYTHELVQNLRRLGLGDRVILFGRNQKAAGSSYHDISYAERAANLLYREYRLPAELSNRHVDIYHSPRYMGLPDPSKLPCPSVMTLHDIILVRMAGDYYGRLRARLYEKWLLERVRAVEHIITGSEFSKRDLVDWSGIDPGGVSVVYDGVSERFRTVGDEDALGAVRSRYSLPPQFVLCLGSTEPRKNIRTAIEAFQQLGRVEPSLRLVITGVDYRRISPEKAFAGCNLNGVHFTGYVADADMPALYSLADVFLFPSLYEGFGLPPLEAMACGTPVVASNATSLPEVIGDAAVLVDPEDGAGFAGAVEMVISSGEVRSGLVEKGRARAAAFDWRRTAEETRKIYEQVIACHRTAT